MSKFRNKPVVFEAERFHVSGDPECYPIGVKWESNEWCGGEGCYVVVSSRNVTAPVRDGDWVITEPDGRGQYPCDPVTFAATYEPVE